MVVGLQARKVWRIAKRVPHQAFSDWWGVLTNRDQLFALSLAVLTSWIGLQTASIPEVLEEASAWANALQAVIYVSLGWAIICLIRAPWIVVRNDRALGTFSGHHFTFRAPHLVATARLNHLDGKTQAVALDMSDAEPWAMVYISAEVTPASAASRVLTYLQSGSPSREFAIPPPMPRVFTGAVHPGAYQGTRVSQKGNMTLYVRLEPNTVPVTIRVFCNQFYLGKSDERYS